MISVYWAGIGGNIIHMENGREPDAGVSLISYVIVPIFFYGVASLGKWVFGEFGWCVIFALLFVFLIYTALCLPNEVKRHKELLRERIKS